MLPRSTPLPGRPTISPMKGDHSRSGTARVGLTNGKSNSDGCYQGDATASGVRGTGRNRGTYRSSPASRWHALLQAFRMDVTTQRFSRLSRICLFYCRHSANPVGHLVLHLFGERDRDRLFLCPIPFVQDCSWPISGRICLWTGQKGRLYVPLEDLDRFGYTEEELARGVLDGRFRRTDGVSGGTRKGVSARRCPVAGSCVLGPAPVRALPDRARRAGDPGSGSTRSGMTSFTGVRSLSALDKAGILLRSGSPDDSP